jgi:hypothetical protein
LVGRRKQTVRDLGFTHVVDDVGLVLDNTVVAGAWVR